MGGGLMQKVNRDTMQFATKLSHIVYADGAVREVAKMPKTDPAKASVGQLGFGLETGYGVLSKRPALINRRWHSDQ